MDGNICKCFVVDGRPDIVLTCEDICDLVTTALEGGIGYWACLDNTGEDFENAPKDESVSETSARLLLDGKTLVFFDEEDGSKYVLDIKKLMGGISEYVSRGDDCYGVFTGGSVDMGNCDAEVADSIVQLAMFGEYVFG